MRNNMVYVAIAAGLALVALGGLAIFLFERPTTLRLAVLRDSDDQAVLAAAAQKFTHDRDTIRLKLLPVDSVADAARSFDQGQVDLAVVRTDIEMPSNGQSVLIMRKNLVILVAPDGSTLHSIDDLKGHRLGVLRNTPLMLDHGQPGLIDTIFAQYDVSRQSVSMVPLTIDELQSAFADKRIDAVLAVGVPDSGVLAKTVATVTALGEHPVFIPISEAKAIAARSPFYELSEVVRGLFGGTPPRPAKTFETLSVGTRLVAQSTLRDDTVTAVTKLLLMIRPVLALRYPIANRIEAPSTSRGEALPVHPGAAAYLDDDEESFFDKYSDAIYIGALCISALGSAAAALASRLGRRPAESDDEAVARLVTIIKASRDASPQQLEALETEADELLAAALTPEAMRLKTEGQRLGALALAFEHARHALAERRKALPAGRNGFEPRVVHDRDG